ncbi:MAG: DUF349 domain-containing protein [Balneolales bacterium]|nr:DUF349 domain-containing protein [Balneolales bacterium]
MQTENNQSSKHLFENEYCFISAEGALTQKNNSIFSGRVLEESLNTENMQERIDHYKAAFAMLEDKVGRELESLGENLDVTASDNFIDKVHQMLSEADAIGDFENLNKRVREKLASLIVTIPGEQQEPETDKGIVPDDHVEAPAATAVENSDASGSAEESKDEAETEPEPADFYASLTSQAQQLDEVRNLRNASATYQELQAKWAAGPDFDHIDYYKLKDKFDAVGKTLEDRRLEYQKQQEERRKQNLAQREEYLNRLQSIIDNKKWAAKNEVDSVVRKFENIKQLPQQGPAEQEKKLQELLEIFKENRVEYVVAMRQKEEENLAGKLLTLEKIENLVKTSGPNTEDWDALEAELQSLLRNWKKIGRIPREKDDELWARLNAAREQFFEMRVDHDEVFKVEMDRSIEKRLSIITTTESLKDHESIAEASIIIKKLHNDWKNLANIPQQQHDELWDRFKKASDEFNAYKDENLDELRSEEQKNLELKQALIAKAEQLTDDEKWKGGARKMEELLEEWKNIGPVPKKHNNSSWKQFRKAMDAFYKARRNKFKEERNEQQQNLKEKRDIVARILELSETENLDEALTEVKELQEKYKKIGFVPIKQKDKIWTKYREACDAFYGAVRKNRSSISPTSNAANTVYAEATAEKQINSEIFKLRKEGEQIRNQILQYADNKTYFKPNKKGQKLIDEIQNNIDEAENELQEKENRIKELKQELKQIKKEKEADN